VIDHGSKSRASQLQVSDSALEFWSLKSPRFRHTTGEDNVRCDCSRCDRVGDDVKENLVRKPWHTSTRSLHGGSVSIETMSFLRSRCRRIVEHGTWMRVDCPERIFELQSERDKGLRVLQPSLQDRKIWRHFQRSSCRFTCTKSWIYVPNSGTQLLAWKDSG